MVEPLSNEAAQKLAREILKSGSYLISTHTVDEMAKDEILDVDILNAIKAGWVERSEYENGEWRYRFMTNRMVVIVAFESTTELAVVTAWRS